MPDIAQADKHPQPAFGMQKTPLRIKLILQKKQLTNLYLSNVQEIPQSKLKLLTVQTSDVLCQCGLGTEVTVY